LEKNVPITLDNSRKFDSTSYLTSDPAVLRAAAERAAKASKAINGEPDSAEEEEESEGSDDEEEEDEEMPEAGPSTIRPTEPKADQEQGDDRDGEAGEDEEEEEQEEEQSTAPPAPPKIMITTSPSPCKLTYQFCDELKNVFPGGQFFKRPRGKGFELGRLARWGIKRGFGAVIVVNEDHKQPSELESCGAVRVAR
jgi:ribosome production factor 1